MEEVTVAGRPIHTFEVVRSERLAPHMTRVVLGSGFATFTPTAFTDSYVKIVLPRPGTDVSALPTPLTLDGFKELPAEQQPVVRTYTVRHVDAERREISIDFVVHGEQGVAGPWAASARTGSTRPTSWAPAAPTRPIPPQIGTCSRATRPGCPRMSTALEALPPNAIGHGVHRGRMDRTTRWPLVAPRRCRGSVDLSRRPRRPGAERINAGDFAHHSSRRSEGGAMAARPGAGLHPRRSASRSCTTCGPTSARNAV